MLVSARDMLVKAKEGHYAVGQFNINNLEWTKSVLLTAQELQSPVILGGVEFYSKALYHRSCEAYVALVSAKGQYSYRIFLSYVECFLLTFVYVLRI